MMIIFMNKGMGVVIFVLFDFLDDFMVFSDLKVKFVL